MKIIYLIIVLCAVTLMGCDSQSKPHAAAFNDPASITPADALPVNPLLWKVLSSGVNKKQHTMHTVYANDTAFTFAKSGLDSAWPANASVAVVTWEEQEDTHWFGGNMPDKIKSVELITIDSAHTPAYALYEGSPLKYTAGGTSKDFAVKAEYWLKRPVSQVP